MDIYEIIGVLGFLAYISAYALLQAGYLDGRRMGYILLNLVAASLVLISLTDKFNLASALIQLSWIAISLWGLSKLLLSSAHYPHSEKRNSRYLSSAGSIRRGATNSVSHFSADTSGAGGMMIGSMYAATTADGTDLSRIRMLAKKHLAGQIRLWMLRSAVLHERRQLKKMDDSLLNDIGIGRTEALLEANRSFRDVPVGRLREERTVQ